MPEDYSSCIFPLSNSLYASMQTVARASSSDPFSANNDRELTSEPSWPSSSCSPVILTGSIEAADVLRTCADEVASYIERELMRERNAIEEVGRDCIEPEGGLGIYVGCS